MLADNILFIDAEAIVLDKPSGLAVDPPRDGGLSLENHARSLTFGFKRWPTPVHRLDRDTSGCLLLARTDKAHRRFQQAWEAGLAEKTYLAVVEGVPDAAEGLIDMALAKVSTRETGWRMVADRKGKPARTAWERVAVAGGRSLIRFRPETGRTHQLRVHAATGLGCAIVGDPVYGPVHGAGRGRGPMLLHASALLLPREGKPAIEAVAPPPPGFARAGFDAG